MAISSHFSADAFQYTLQPSAASQRAIHMCGRPHSSTSLRTLGMQEQESEPADAARMGSRAAQNRVLQQRQQRQVSSLLLSECP